MNIAIDVIFVLLGLLVFYLGYRKGFLTKAWWLVDLAVITIVGGLLAPTIFDAIKTKTNWYTALVEKLASVEGKLNIQAESLAETIIVAGIWIALGIVVTIILAIFKALLRKLVRYSVVSVIDKILGGVYSVVLFVAVLMVLGALVGTLDVFEPIRKASETCSECYVFRYIFGANPLQTYADKYVPLGEWIQKVM